MSAEGPAGGPVDPIIIEPFGEAALLVVLGETPDRRLARRARALGRLVAGGALSGVRVGAPRAAGASLLVPFDPRSTRGEEVTGLLLRLAAQVPHDPPPDPGARELTVPVRYGGVDGPDLADVAARFRRTPADIVEAHLAADHEVLFLGFAPGFAYIGGLPDWLRVPRLDAPRVRVEAGSVGLAGELTGIYPQASPGGWRIVGRSELTLFDPSRAEPSLLRPGDLVRFVAL